ncbi:MAG: DUF3037 domain-containing protein [Bacteroidota bacterium]
MPDRVTYEFAMIRLVPKVEREEFLNIGVVVMSRPKKYLGIKFKLDEERITAFSKDVDLALIHEYLKAWQLICQGSPHGGAIGKMDLTSRYRWLVSTRSTMIQCSETHPGLCDDPAQVLEDLWQRYVA